MARSLCRKKQPGNIVVSKPEDFDADEGAKISLQQLASKIPKASVKYNKIQR